MMRHSSGDTTQRWGLILWATIPLATFHLFACPSASGQSEVSQNELEELSQILEPVIDEATLGLAHIDTKQLDEKSLTKKAKSLLWSQDADSEFLKQLVRYVSQTKKQIERCGGRFVFLTASLYDLEQATVIAIPVAANSQTTELERLLKPVTSMGFQLQKLNSRLLILARPKTLARIANRELWPRKDVKQILQRSVHGIASLNFVPSADHLKVIRELTPKLDPPFSSVTGELLADGVQFASIRLQQFEPLDIEVRINSVSDQAARQLKQLILGLRDEIKPTTPESLVIKGVAAQLSLEQVDQSLSLKVGAKEEAVWNAIKPFFEAAQKRVGQSALRDKLRDIMIALHNYYDANKMFPDIGPLKDKGNPGLSWRVHILPYVGEAALYEKFKLDEPWDSEHNKQLIPLLPEVFVVKGGETAKGKTRIVMPRGRDFFAKPFVRNQAAKPTEKIGRQFREILDGTSNTLAVLPIASQYAVIWTKPEDWVPPAKDLIKSVIDPDQKILTFATADGAVHRIDLSQFDEKKFKAWLTIAGGDYSPNQ